MRLDHLLSEIGVQFDQASAITCVDMTLDSRQVIDGSLFVALQGTSDHGMHYVSDAITAGAVAVIYDEWAEDIPQQIPALRINGLRQKLGHLAQAFYGNPADQMRVIGVTGTNGKTTVVHLIAQLAEHIGVRAACIGTLGVSIGAEKLLNSDRTTPDAITLASMFADLKNREVELVAMEVSSHALDQFRVDGVSFDAAVMTNLSRDHLDYHGTMEAYGHAKERLFHDFPIQSAVLNADDEYCRQIVSSISESQVITYGRDADSVRIRAIVPSTAGTQVDIEVDGQVHRVESDLLGEFNASNLVAAFASLYSLFPESSSKLLEAIPRLNAAPGRMESFSIPDSPTVVVDYAHTPDALSNALSTCRQHAHGNLWCVFGCGGDRDTGKRPLMGSIAEELSDYVILTSDNPRSEPPQQIIDNIREGMANAPHLVEFDRSKAIEYALHHAAANDLVLLAGKGHESTQVIGQQMLTHSDRAEVARLFGLLEQGVQHAS